jgi:hypothetical protein
MVKLQVGHNRFLSKIKKYWYWAFKMQEFSIGCISRQEILFSVELLKLVSEKVSINSHKISGIRLRYV